MAVTHKVDSIKALNEAKEIQDMLPVKADLALEANAELGDTIATLMDAVAELGELIAGEV